MEGTSITQATTELPSGYHRQSVFDPAEKRWFVLGAVALGIVLLIVVGRLQVLFLDWLRPEALDGLRFSDIVTQVDGGGTSLALPFPVIGGAIVALISVLLVHELVHGLFFWWFAGRRPRFGIKGLFPYATAPSGVYFPRNRFLVVGLAPLVLLNSIGMLAIVVAPVVAVPAVLVFCALNASGAAGDLLMVAWLLSHPSETVVEDADTSVILYVPAVQPADRADAHGASIG